MTEEALCCKACGLPIEESQLRIHVVESGAIIHEDRKCVELWNKASSQSKKNYDDHEKGKYTKYNKYNKFNKYKQPSEVQLCGCAYIYPDSRKLDWQTSAGTRSAILSIEDLAILISAFVRNKNETKIAANLDGSFIHSLKGKPIAIAEKSGMAKLCLGREGTPSYVELDITNPAGFIAQLSDVRSAAREKLKPRRIVRR